MPSHAHNLSRSSITKVETVIPICPETFVGKRDPAGGGCCTWRFYLDRYKAITNPGVPIRFPALSHPTSIVIQRSHLLSGYRAAIRIIRQSFHLWTISTEETWHAGPHATDLYPCIWGQLIRGSSTGPNVLCQSLLTSCMSEHPLLCGLLHQNVHYAAPASHKCLDAISRPILRSGFGGRRGICRCRNRRRSLLPDNLSGVKFHKHSRIRLQVFDGNGKSEIVQDQELNLEVIKFCQRQTADLDGECC